MNPKRQQNSRRHDEKKTLFHVGHDTRRAHCERERPRATSSAQIRRKANSFSSSNGATVFIIQVPPSKKGEGSSASLASSRACHIINISRMYGSGFPPESGACRVLNFPLACAQFRAAALAGVSLNEFREASTRTRLVSNLSNVKSERFLNSVKRRASPRAHTQLISLEEQFFYYFRQNDAEDVDRGGSVIRFE